MLSIDPVQIDRVADDGHEKCESVRNIIRKTSYLYYY